MTKKATRKGSKTSDALAKAASAAVQQETAEQARKRAQQCNAALQKVLQEYNCAIAPFIEQPRAVGDDQRTVQISANFGVVPMALPE